MNEVYIEDEETMYRAILAKMPNAITNGRVSAAVFIDKNGGTSVERDGERCHEEIVKILEERFNRNGKENNYVGSASITAEKCRETGAYPTPQKTRNNEFHAEIHESETATTLSLGKAMLIARECSLHLK